MVGNGNHPLKHGHYDDITLHEYVLGQLLPDDEQAIRQHIATCAECRARVAELEVFCRQVATELNRDLERTQPGSSLSFDHIAREWRKPPRRVTWWYKLQEYAPSSSTLVLLGLLAFVLLMIFPSGDTAALRGLDLIDDYDGPPAVVAAVSQDSLVIVHLAPDDVHVIAHFDHVSQPRNLRFSPDGRWLALQDGRVLRVLETRSTGLQADLAVSDTADWAWSPDSTQLAYTDGTGQLAIFDVLAQASRVIVPADELAWGAPVWSADGQQIAYAVVAPLPAEDSTVQRQSIWRVDPSSGYRIEIARNPAPDTMLWIPAAWVNGEDALLAWDMNAGIDSLAPTLYRIETAAHAAMPVEGQSLAQGTRLLWPVSAQGTTLVYENQLVALDLAAETRQPIPDQIPWPQGIEWSPNGAWMAYTVASAPDGQGLYVFALQDGKLRQITLPAGASEKEVMWAGMEHLFVVRQRPNLSTNELWLVSLTTGAAPQRILSGVQLPRAVQHNGWRWQDVVAAQVLPH